HDPRLLLHRHLTPGRVVQRQLPNELPKVVGPMSRMLTERHQSLSVAKLKPDVPGLLAGMLPARSPNSNRIEMAKLKPGMLPARSPGGYDCLVLFILGRPGTVLGIIPERNLRIPIDLGNMRRT
ncbi:hypothetical protein Tco_0176342, partial [Tanacetum coccineum]